MVSWFLNLDTPVRRLLTALGLLPLGPTCLFEDTQACIMTSDFAVHKARSKHIQG
jgi:hypothetical protein